MSANATTSRSVSWTPSTAGTRDVYVVVDGEDLITEDSEINNTASTSYTIYTSPELHQNYWRWRNDSYGLTTNDGWIKGENTSPNTVAAGEDLRLRIGLANTATTGSSTNFIYSLEYAEKNGASCGDDETFSTVPSLAGSQPFEIISSSQYTDQASTTGDFLSSISTTTWSNGYGVENTSTSTGFQTLLPGKFTELEFTLNTTGDVINTPYCFRLSDTNSSTDYFVYASSV